MGLDMKKFVAVNALVMFGTVAMAQIDPGAYWRGAEQARQQNMQDMLNAQQYQYMQQQLQRQQSEQMMRNATRQNVDAINVVSSGMLVNDVVSLFGAYPFHRSVHKGYDVMQWCRTNPPGYADDYALVYFYEGKVAKTERGTQMADMDCRTKPVAMR